MFIKNLPIRIKLALLSLLPMLVALGFIGHDISLNIQTWRVMSHGHTLNQLTQQANQLVHQLQIERGLSAGFLNTDNHITNSPLQRQYPETIRERTAFLSQLEQFDAANYSAKLSQLLETVYRQLAQLEQIRSQISAHQISTTNAVSFYNGLNNDLLSITNEFSLLTEDLSVSHAATAYYFFTMAKEHSGRERALLNAAFSKNRFDNPGFQAFISSLTRQELYTLQFQKHATEDHLSQVNKLLPAHSKQSVQAFRQQALTSPQKLDANPDTWFRAATQRIELMKKAEDYLAQELSNEVALHQQQATQSLFTLVTLAATASVLVVLITFYISRLIVRQIWGLGAAIHEVEQNSDLTVEAPIITEDELGQLASHFNNMVCHLRSLTRSVTDAGDELQQMVSQVQGVAIGVNTEVSQGLNQTNMIAAALEQMGLSVGEVASNCSMAAEQSDQANSAACDGVGMVNSAHQSIASLSRQIDNAMEIIDQVASDSEEIGSILDVITGIAEQTNLLALNAAIEAARAGDQGRGFAVVADEVRGLAHKTQESSARVQSMIEQLQGRSREAVQAMQDSHARTGSTVDGFSQVLTQLQSITHQADSVNQMNLRNAAATEQQSATVNEINVNIQDVQRRYNETNDKVSSLNQSARQLEDLSRMLFNEASQFKV